MVAYEALLTYTHGNDGMLGKGDRILIEVDLKPVQGNRFQPTGFPDLGHAEIQTGGGIDVLVESSQSMANRMESVCLNEIMDDFVDSLQGLPMIKVVDEKGKHMTNSILEAHRISSHYIDTKNIQDAFSGLNKGSIWDTSLPSIAEIVFKIDTNSLIHGVWVSKKEIAGGRVRIPRALSSFIEAKNAKNTISGGVKLDHINPGKDEDAGGAKEGQGNIPYPRTEYTAESITAYFNLDLRQIRAYGLDDDRTDLLINLSLWKIRKFLESGLRLRTACDLEVSGEPRTKPDGFVLPSTPELDKSVRESISKCKKHWGEPIQVTYAAKKKSGT